MRNFAKWVIAATVGAGALPCIGIGAAAAADIPVPYGQPRYSEPQPAPPEYYPEERYGYREAPADYVYPAPPPPVYRYYYGPPAVAVVPPPVYRYPYYAFRRNYAFRPYGPRIVHGPYGYPRAYRHW